MPQLDYRGHARLARPLTVAERREYASRLSGLRDEVKQVGSTDADLRGGVAKLLRDIDADEEIRLLNDVVSGRVPEVPKR